MCSLLLFQFFYVASIKHQSDYARLFLSWTPTAITVEKLAESQRTFLLHRRHLPVTNPRHWPSHMIVTDRRMPNNPDSSTIEETHPWRLHTDQSEYRSVPRCNGPLRKVPKITDSSTPLVLWFRIPQRPNGECRCLPNNFMCCCFHHKRALQPSSQHLKTMAWWFNNSMSNQITRYIMYSFIMFRQSEIVVVIYFPEMPFTLHSERWSPVSGAFRLSI